MLLNSLLICGIFSLVSCGRIDAHNQDESTKGVKEKSHHDLVFEKMKPSVSEDHHIKVLKMDRESVHDSKFKGTIKQTDSDETKSTTSISPESISHSTNMYERTTQTQSIVHKTTKENTKSPTEMSHYSRSKRSFSKDEMESFSEMAKVFSESFKKFNDDAQKAQTDFMSFMKKLDDISASHDKYD